VQFLEKLRTQFAIAAIGCISMMQHDQQNCKINSLQIVRCDTICSFASVTCERKEKERRERPVRKLARMRAFNLKSDSPFRPIRPSLLHRRTLNLRFPWRRRAHFASAGGTRARTKGRKRPFDVEINRRPNL
jgi:hypothetical protein